MTPPPAFDMIAAGRTDVGRMRSRNEDAFRVVPTEGIAVVCDGMGGHAGGDVASSRAASVIADVLSDSGADGTLPPATAGSVETTVSGPTVSDPVILGAVSQVRLAVREANRALCDANREQGHPEGRGMGTTVAGLWRADGTDRVVVFHAGDSRVYRLRGGAMAQLTRDHSLYQIWLDNGGRGQAPPRNVIVRALGTAELTEPEITVHAIAPDDIFLLCSDGLTGMVGDPAIAEVLSRAAADPAGVADRLVDMANAKGGVDNITVVVVRFRRVA